MIYSDADVHMCWELENRFDWSLLPRKICESCEVLGRLHSAPPIAILECALAILSYCMQPTDVHIPNSYWTEPVVIWSFLGMPTGSSKSSIYKYLLKLTAAIQKELDVRSPYASSWTLNEAALEKMRAVLLLDHQKATVSSEVSQSQTLNQPGPYSGAQVSSFDLEMICLPLVGFSEPLTNKALIKDVRSHTLYLAPVYGDYDSLKIQPGEDLISDFMLKTLAIVGANLWIERQNDDDEALSQSNAVRDKLLKGDDSYLLFETETANKSQSNKRRSIPIEYTIDEESGMFKNIFNYFQHELKYFSHRDSLLSSLLTKAKGQVLRLAAPIHILVDAASSVVNEDYIPTNVISERSIAVAHALVKLSIAQTAFLSGRKINCDSLELIKDTIELEESVTIETPKSTTKNPFKSEIVILTSPGRIVSGSQLLEKKRFVGRDGLKPKEILTACVYSLEDDGLGTVENIRSGNGKTASLFGY
uniref:Uncharacterized protein LOC102810106 n=1 Tax=Saccoglossus kowalevskii TaxID=10224 RepID=A0ABM0MLS6_SACKO|nr:PREDICTED: uncharacterized protein LOC102810106 [Saccoglossus kowalevskii]